MKILAVSDVHLGLNLFNLPALGLDLFRAYERAVEKAIELKVNLFVSVGDLFDTNKPLAEHVDFVRGLNRRLKAAGITSAAISGDHSKAINGYDWEQVCDFQNANQFLNIIAINYNDNPASVIAQLHEELVKKPSVEFIFLHGQVPELWVYCDEKKLLPLKDILLGYPLEHLKGVFLGDIHKPFQSTLLTGSGKEVFVGYCGSLGITRLDEQEKLGYLYYDEKVIQRIQYPLERKILDITITSEWLDALTEVEKTKSVLSLVKHEEDFNNKPVVILRCDSKAKARLNELNFIYENAIVTEARINKSGALEVVSIRSEISNEANYETTLRQLTSLTTQPAFDLALSLVKDPEGSKRILDDFKKMYFTDLIQEKLQYPKVLV